MNALVSENNGLRDEVVHLNDVIKQVTNGKEGDYNILPLSTVAFISYQQLFFYFSQAKLHSLDQRLCMQLQEARVTITNRPRNMLGCACLWYCSLLACSSML